MIRVLCFIVRTKNIATTTVNPPLSYRLNIRETSPNCIRTLNRNAPFVGSYALAHLVVDAACAFLVLGVLDIGVQPILSLLIYNALAFVLQIPIGMMVDRTLNPKIAAILGLILVSCSFLFW